MEIATKFDFDKVRFDQDNDVHLLLSLKAPKLNWVEQRAKLAIMPAIDISSSMGFSGKLAYAKESLIKMIDHLSSEDFCGLVTFASNAVVLSPPLAMTADNKLHLQSLVKKLQAYGNTAFASGMLQSLKELNKLEADVIRRVIMFTDGEANVGASKLEDILSLLPEHLGRTTVSAFGYGKDAKQDILNSLAAEAKGNYAFIETPDNAPAAFAKELGGLLSVFATDLKITIRSKTGVILDQVISEVTHTAQDGSLEIKVPELLSEEVRNLVIKCKIAAGTEPQELEALEVEINSMTMHPVQEVTRKVSATIQLVTCGEHQDKPTKDVDEVVTFNQMIRAQIDAGKLAEKGLYQAAEDRLESFALMSDKKGLANFSSLARKTRGRLSNNIVYTQNASYLASFNGLTRGVGTSSFSSEALEELKTFQLSDQVQLNNSTQDFLMDSFKK